MLNRDASTASMTASGISTISDLTIKPSAMTTRSTIGADEDYEGTDKEKGATYIEDARGSSDEEMDHTLRRRMWRRDATAWSAIRDRTYRGGGTTDDPFVISWIGEADERENPYRWKKGYKWFLTMMSATGMLAVTMGSSIISATIQSIKDVWPGHHPMLYIMVTGIYILGFTVGPFLWAPFSEVFGRRLTVVITFIPFTILNAGVCGSQNLNTMLLLRFFAGTFGCSAMTNSGAVIADMFESHERGLAMGVFAAMPFLGPVIGPIAGGFLGPATKWEWVAAVVAFFALFITVAEICLLPETCAPVILRRRAKLLTKVTGKLHLSEQDVAKPLDTKALMKRQLQVPFRLLFTEPIVMVLALYQATVFAILYLQFTSFPIVFQGQRHWSPGIGALAFVPVAIGSNLGLVYLALYVNPRYAKLHKEKGYLPPEARLSPAMIGAILLPTGLMWFAWTCAPVSIHWIVPMLAAVPYGTGVVLTFLATQNYLVDAYLPYAASVIAGGTVVRSVLGVVLPLFTIDMYNALGVNWASALVAFIALLFTPVPFLLRAYGRRIRRLTAPGREADDLSLMIAATAAKTRAQVAAKVGVDAAAAGAPGVAAAEGEIEQGEVELVEDEEREKASRYATPMSRLSPTPTPRVDLGDEEMGIEGQGEKGERQKSQT